MKWLLLGALLLTACGAPVHGGPRATIGPTTPQPTAPAVPAVPYPPPLAEPVQTAPFLPCGEARTVTDPLDGRVWVEQWFYEERDSEGNLVRVFCPGAPTPQPTPGPTPQPTPEPVLTPRVVLSPVLRVAAP